MIEVNAVAFAYPGQSTPVLEEFNLILEPGSFVTIAGRNGCGKSTLAKLLNGLLLPCQGQVLVNGLSTGERANLWDIRQAVQLVFQNPENQLIGGTVEEDIVFGLENLGVPRSEMIERIDWVLDVCHLQRLRTRPVAGLSGGEKQRVALASALVMRPQYLILDESASMLDNENRSELWELISDLRGALNTASRLAIIQITQELDDALASDRVLVLNAGRIILDGAPATALTAEELEEIGLLPPAVVRLGRELRQAGMPVANPCLGLDDLVDAICELI